jgi:hypothetical protein
MKSPIFARIRSEAVTAVLLAAGSSLLVGCSSDEKTYRPAPRYTTPPATTARPAPTYTGPTYTAPAPTYTAPQAQPVAPPPAPAGGQMACGKGKCG